MATFVFITENKTKQNQNGTTDEGFSLLWFLGTKKDLCIYLYVQGSRTILKTIINGNFENYYKRESNSKFGTKRYNNWNEELKVKLQVRYCWWENLWTGG